MESFFSIYFIKHVLLTNKFFISEYNSKNKNNHSPIKSNVIALLSESPGELIRLHNDYCKIHACK